MWQKYDLAMGFRGGREGLGLLSDTVTSSVAELLLRDFVPARTLRGAGKNLRETAFLTDNRLLEGWWWWPWSGRGGSAEGTPLSAAEPLVFTLGSFRVWRDR